MYLLHHIIDLNSQPGGRDRLLKNRAGHPRPVMREKTMQIRAITRDVNKLHQNPIGKPQRLSFVENY